MRSHLVAAVSLLALAACSGGGPESVGSSAVVGGAAGTVATAAGTFVAPTEKKTYSAIGGVEHYEYSTDNRKVAGQYGQLYTGNASTARNSGITISYDPRDAIFELTIADPTAKTSNTLRFQDPEHRTNFGGLVGPQGGTPNILNSGIQYLEAGSSSNVSFDVSQSTTFPTGNNGGSRDVSTFFYQKPGTTTKYVTYAGFVRNATSVSLVTPTDGSAGYLKQANTLERAAFAFGERTSTGSVPKIGTGTYTGGMLATMVYNDRPDISTDAPTYFQWITGTSTVNIDFAASAVKTSFAGTVLAPQFDVNTSRTFSMPTNSAFAASGTAAIDLVNAGGFTGKIDSAGFTKPDGTKVAVNIAGSSVDGAFYGPKGEEVGGGFRVVGGTPDQRIDILGTFTGATPTTP